MPTALAMYPRLVAVQYSRGMLKNLTQIGREVICTLSISMPGFQLRRMISLPKKYQGPFSRTQSQATRSMNLDMYSPLSWGLSHAWSHISKRALSLFYSSWGVLCYLHRGVRLHFSVDGFGSRPLGSGRQQGFPLFGVLWICVWVGRPASSGLGRGLVEMVPVALDHASSDPGGNNLPIFEIPISWIPDLAFHSMPTPTTEPLGLILSSYPGGYFLPVFEIPKSRVPDLGTHSVPTPTPKTGSMGLLLTGPEAGSPDPFEGFIGGRLLGSHGSVRASVTATSRKDGVQTTLTNVFSVLSSNFGCCWGPNPAEVSFRSIWVKGSLTREVPRAGVGAGLGFLHRCWAFRTGLPRRFLSLLVS